MRNDEALQQAKREAISNHICEFYPYPTDLRNEVKSASYSNTVCLQGAKHLVTGGCFLIYYSEVTEFMKQAGFDSTLSDTAMWELYIYVMSSMIMEIVKGE